MTEVNGGHIGTVVSTEGGMATVNFERSSMCRHCGACMSFGEKEMRITLKNELNAREGDRVEVSLAAKTMLLASVLCYALPLALLILGVWLGSLLGDLWALVIGLGLCAATFFPLRYYDKKRGKRFIPKMTRILTED